MGSLSFTQAHGREKSQIPVLLITNRIRSGLYVCAVLVDSRSRLQRLLVELESIDLNGTIPPENQARRSEVLQSILELFSANLETRNGEKTTGTAS